MKKNKYIQPAIENVKVQHTSALCGVSLKMGGDLGGGSEDEPVVLYP